MGKYEETDTGVECSVLDVCFSFDVGRSMFDVRHSSFKTTLYDINVISEVYKITERLWVKASSG